MFKTKTAILHEVLLFIIIIRTMKQNNEDVTINFRNLIIVNDKLKRKVKSNYNTQIILLIGILGANLKKKPITHERKLI